MKYRKKAPMPRSRPRRSVLRKNRKSQEQTRAVCYSASHLLIDALEGNGFAVYRIEQHEPRFKRFSLEVEFALDNKALLDLLDERLKAATS
ncbi:MAG: hypothetical protein LBG91_05380 [Treponema sp.]|jgi:hypothetical protein|nr:hypothetical protein [Treponema sp.]